jgi:hypothetical protein
MRPIGILFHRLTGISRWGTAPIYVKNKFDVGHVVGTSFRKRLFCFLDINHPYTVKVSFLYGNENCTVTARYQTRTEALKDIQEIKYKINKLDLIIGHISTN